ncbi:MAG: response regulator, partial [Lentisphaeraceae bacterium]|nr:response regulator [Lentisphaeraceae bacterium]
MRALIIDDDDIIIQTVPDLLEILEFETVAFTDPYKAIQYLKTNSVDLILCDLTMPDITGLEVFTQTKTLCPEAIFMLMTGYASVESAVDAMRMGITDYLQKPFSFDHLRQVTERALREKRLKKENRDLKVKLGGQQKGQRSKF